MSDSLRRKILDGKQYESLLPKVVCERRFVGKGSTDFSVSQMKNCVTEFNYQTKPIARLLNASELGQLCNNVHVFLFNHFDYDADTDDQFLRSPACSWYHRYSGIDCKSYTIVASCILTNLQVNHFIRKVSYDEPGNYTHVYAIIPVDQSISNWEDLGDYYMIDGTIPTMKELDYKYAKDEFMSGMKHYVLNGRPYLNGLASTPEDQPGDGGSGSGISFNQIGSFFKKINFSSISGLFSNIACWGGTAYNADILGLNVTKLNDEVNNRIIVINQDVAQLNTTKLASDLKELFARLWVIWDASILKKSDFNGNSCTDGNFDAFINVVSFYLFQVFPALQAHLDQYFTILYPNGTIPYTNFGLEAEGYFFLEGNFQTVVYPADFIVTVKPNVTAITMFEFTAPIVDAAANNTPVNVPQVLSSLQTVIWTAGAIISATGNGNGTNPNNSGSYTLENGGGIPPKTDKAGLGTFATVGLGLALAFWAFSGENPVKLNEKK